MTPTLYDQAANLRVAYFICRRVFDEAPPGPEGQEVGRLLDEAMERIRHAAEKLAALHETKKGPGQGGQEPGPRRGGSGMDGSYSTPS